MKKSYFILGIVAIISLFLIEGELSDMDMKVYQREYRGRDGLDRNTFAARALGIKKGARSVIWMSHVVNTGHLLGGDSQLGMETLRKGSERITYLDPYFVRNYTFTGGILAFIRTYNDFKGAFHIFQKGIEYNPDEVMLKKYLAGAMAGKKGDAKELIKLFEEIVKETNDDLLVNTLAFSYEKMYDETGIEVYNEKALYYWVKLLHSKNEKYRSKAEEKIKKQKI
jgi:hypothetical protein